MIKVFQVSSDTNIGGAGKCILTFLENYNRSSFDMAVVLPYHSLLKEKVEALGVRTIEVEGINEKSLGRKGVSALRRVFKQERPDIVHTHASMSARIAARLCHIPGIVYTRHSVFEPSPTISKGAGKKINGLVNNCTADRIIAVAEAAKQNLVDCGVDESKIDVVLNGINPLEPMDNQQKEAVRRRYGIQPGQKVISILARLEEVKGHAYLIEAAKLVLDAGCDVVFLIAGTGSQGELLKQKVRQMNLEKNILFTGFVEDVREIVNITDISANASYGTEATSIALLEGMCLGKPAVVSEFGGNPGVIIPEENGLLFPIKNSQRMAEAFLSILKDDKLYQTLSEGAVRIFQERFTAKRYTQQIETIYKELMQKGTR